ncbi:MAG: hypothetical protein H0U84_04885 [Thermoleophilaceae bacterium]|nr:hypothetical protein [Thermoleophilaceae bacterium]
MRIIYILFAMVAITSCTDNANITEEHTDSTIVQNPGKNEPEPGSFNKEPGEKYADVNGCYMKILKRDTIAIKLYQTGTSVTGKLTFDNYEKDGSTGTVHGIIEGNIIKLWYNFASEGMNSVMEIYFKKQGNQLLRGIGPFDAKYSPDAYPHCNMSNIV